MQTYFIYFYLRVLNCFPNAALLDVLPLKLGLFYSGWVHNFISSV